MKQFYLINTLSGSAKPITNKKAIIKLVNRPFYTVYEDEQISFIVDIGFPNVFDVIDIVNRTLRTINHNISGKHFNLI